MIHPSGDNTPMVSIITLNWNGTNDTIAFLESTRKLSYRNYEILVCDMNSDVDPADKINSLQFPNTKVLSCDANLGFAAGNNWGMRQAKGDYFFIVNNDTEITPELIDLLLEPFAKDPSIAVVCPKIRFYESRDTIQYAGFTKMNPVTGRTYCIGDKEKDHGQFDKPGYTYGAHGCAMMVKRTITETVGMFPEKFFLYYEEWDWSSRMLKAGYTIYFQPKAVIYHKESMSVGKNSTLKTYYLSRNRILFMRRNSNWPQFLMFATFFTVAAFPKAVLSYSIKRQFPFLKAYIRGIIWNFKNSRYSTV